MQSTKLSLTSRANLARKYTPAALKQIDKAITAWVKADAARGIENVVVDVGDAAALKKRGVKAASGKLTAGKVKQVLDALFAKLTPDYVVLLGAQDVIPMFEVPNPSYDGEDDDRVVPTDNPYASSRKFSAQVRDSYLVPDRVVGRIPDLPGSGDPDWFVSALTTAATAKSVKPADYARDLLVCCDAWIGSGRACAEFLGRAAKSVLVSPPNVDTTKALRARVNSRLHMIKCHGSPLDPCFYGQKGEQYPQALFSGSLTGKTSSTTVVGAMCCYGATVFDPNDPAAQQPGELPIPSVYLKQGAYGFFGSTTIAWVGPETMLCADWVVATFLKNVLGGASLGRAALEAKQDFFRWNQSQGDEVDAADEKTLLQFVLLGDPSLHPVVLAAPAANLTAAALPARAGGGGVMARKQRRATRQRLGEMIREALPTRTETGQVRVPPRVKQAARECFAHAGERFEFGSKPRVERVERKIVAPAVGARGVVAAARKPRGLARPLIRQFYWSARRRQGPVVEIRLVSIQADMQGNPLRTQVLASC